MKRLLVTLVLLACATGSALAGPNAGGTILVHYTPGIAVPADPTFVDGGLTSCPSAVTEAPVGADPILWFAYAAFPGCSSPRLKVVTFGCAFDDTQTAILWTATRAQATQIFYPDQGSWPYAGSGVAVGFFNTLTDQVDEIYTFAGYSYGGQFCLVAHPDPGIGGTFADDGTPSSLDMIAGYGCLGFGAPGSVACPVDHVPGACCLSDGSCEFVCQVQCAGAFMGEGIPCAPNPCIALGACCVGAGCQMLTEEDCVAQDGLFVGGDCTPESCIPQDFEACCFAGNVCQLLTQEDCAAQGGDFIQGPCVPNPCVTPTESSSWGKIKNQFR